IIGRRLAALADVEHADLSAKRVGAAVDGLTGASVNDVSFQMHEGEVVGLTGLVGSGFDEVPYLLFGARSAAAGRLTLDSRAYELAHLTPPAAIEAGIALIPADRPNDGSVGSRLQIFELIRATAREQGVNVLCASSDYEQLASLCDRVIVCGRGRVWRQLVGSEITKDRIIEQCYAAMATEVAGVVA